MKVCDAIAYAHARGVVHRDLKPENVVLGGYGEVVVLDWGLAKLVDDTDLVSDANTQIRERISVSPEASVAQTLGLMGTPSYMAPEQVEQDHAQIDGRTDVYALGGILFEILTGHAPAEGTTGDVLERVRTGRIPHARQLEPTVPRRWKQSAPRPWHLKNRSATSRSPTSRRRCGAGSPMSPLRPTVSHSQRAFRRFMRRHRTLTTAATAAMVVALTALGIAYPRGGDFGQARQCESRPRYQEQRARPVAQKR